LTRTSRVLSKHITLEVSLSYSTKKFREYIEYTRDKTRKELEMSKQDEAVGK